MTATRIITVWMDETDTEGTPYIVDTDLPSGGESATIRCFADRDAAVEFARQEAGKRGMECRIDV